jgi:hypothetical protein
VARGRKDRVPGDGRGEDHGCVGGNVGHHGVDDGLEVEHVADGYLDEIGLGAGDAVTLDHLGEGLNNGGEAGKFVAGYGDLDEGADRKAHASGIDHCAVALDDAALFRADGRARWWRGLRGERGGLTLRRGCGRSSGVRRGCCSRCRREELPCLILFGQSSFVQNDRRRTSATTVRCFLRFLPEEHRLGRWKRLG